MSQVDFKVDYAAYERLLNNGITAGVAAVTEQVGHDANMYVKYDSGALHDSMRVEYREGKGEVSWNTPYALRQYYTGNPIDHMKGEAEPHLMWAAYAESLYRKDWDKMFEKAFARGMMGLSE